MKSLVKTPLNLIGLEVKRTGKGLLGKLVPTERSIYLAGFPTHIKGLPLKVVPSEKDKFKWLQNMNIKTVIDVGAHTGEFALKIHQILPHAKIYSFEPLKDCFEKLNKNSKSIANLQCFNVALGEQRQETEIHHNDFSPSSSLLKLGEHKEHFPFTQGSTKEIIQVDTLDNFTQKLSLQKNILLKIDVQGFEDKVIAGSLSTLSDVKLIIVETSFKELYKSQPLFSDIYYILTKLDFIYLGSWGQLKSPIDGSPCQEDSIFVKR
jgi:FkbM family methyltransferase